MGSTVPNRITVDGKVVETIADIAEQFCSYFSSVGPAAAANCDVNVLNLEEQYTNYGISEFKFRSIDCSTISQHAKKMKADLKGSVTQVPSKVIKQHIGLLLAPLVHIFNSSFAQGIFPKAFKETVCIPLYKGKGDRNAISNYRPISLTPFLAKLLERCAKQQLEAHLESAGFFSSSQFGFRSKRSTEMALCSVTNFITKNCEGGNAVAGLFLDVSKAFDCISHDLLLAFLEKLSLDTRSLQWFKAYLLDREISVHISGTASCKRRLTLGVPQGSVLGPFLFIIYIDSVLQSIVKHCTGSHVVAYADDTTILFQLSKQLWQEQIGILNHYIFYINSLFRSRLLAINAGKTRLVVFKSVHCRIHIPKDSFVIENTVLEVFSETDCLGLRLSSNLKWKKHCHVVSQKCYAVIIMLSRLKQLGHGLEFLLSVYRALFEPVLFYSVSVWGSTFSNIVSKFQIIQNDALRAICGVKRRSSVQFVFRQHNILPVVSVMKYKVGVLMYKKLHGNNALDFIRIEPKTEGHYVLRMRREHDVDVQFSRTVFREHGPEIAFARIWNTFPEDVKHCKTLSEFKKKAKDYLIASKSAECSDP